MGWKAERERAQISISVVSLFSLDPVSAVVPLLPGALCGAGNKVLDVETWFISCVITVSLNAMSMCVCQVQQQPGSAVDSLLFLLPAVLRLPHPASCGKLKPAFWHIFHNHELQLPLCSAHRERVVFLFQIITVAVSVSFWYKNTANFHSFSSIREFETETSQLWSHSGANQPERISEFPQERRLSLEKVTARLYSILLSSALFY